MGKEGGRASLEASGYNARYVWGGSRGATNIRKPLWGERIQGSELKGFTDVRGADDKGVGRIFGQSESSESGGSSRRLEWGGACA